MQAAQEIRQGERGFAMAALLVAMAVMAIVLSSLLPVWHTLSVREKEEELMWRGQQYDRAFQLYRKKNSAPGAPNLDALIKGRFLRKKFKDPITGGDFDLIGVNQAMPAASGAAQAKQPPIGFGQLIGGVRSKSKARSFREPDGATTYNEWKFAYVAWKGPSQSPTGPAGAGTGLMGGRRGPGSGLATGIGGLGSGSIGNRGAGQGRPPQQGRTPGTQPAAPGPGPGRDSQAPGTVVEPAPPEEPPQ